jgi:hypothetical protein
MMKHPRHPFSLMTREQRAQGVMQLPSRLLTKQDPAAAIHLE